MVEDGRLRKYAILGGSATIELASTHPHPSMDPWCRSNITFQRMEGLIRRGLLCVRTLAEEWLLPGEEDLPSPPNGYIVSFAHFHERGFTIPAHRFLLGLLHYYKIEVQHLNPNGIQHMAAFIAYARGS